MKIKIELIPGTSIGRLVINGERKFCPFDTTSDQDAPHCGTWCALFEEPRKWDNRDYNQVSINLCRASWSCYDHEFVDERIKNV